MSAPRLIALFLILSAGAAAATPRRAPYRGAILEDVATGRVMFEDGADEVSPPASMTKLMTFAVASDLIREKTLTLQTQVEVTAADARVAGLKDSTNVALRRGETFPIEELFYAMMIESANDAAYAVAAQAGGTIENFVRMMNAKAAELGMAHTQFRTPNGLPLPRRPLSEGDLTSPRDFAKLCRYLILNTDILKYTSVRTREFGAGERSPLAVIHMTNHNHLLGKIAGVDGLKTGFTNGAGFCLSATAMRNGRRILVVMMDCPDKVSRDVKVAELIARGFSSPSFDHLFSGMPESERPAAPAPSAPEGGASIQFAVPH